MNTKTETFQVECLRTNKSRKALGRLSWISICATRWPREVLLRDLILFCSLGKNVIPQFPKIYAQSTLLYKEK